MSKIIGRVFKTVTASKPEPAEKPATDKKKPTRKAVKD